MQPVLSRLSSADLDGRQQARAAERSVTVESPRAVGSPNVSPGGRRRAFSNKNVLKNALVLSRKTRAIKSMDVLKTVPLFAGGWPAARAPSL